MRNLWPAKRAGPDFGAAIVVRNTLPFEAGRMFEQKEQRNRALLAIWGGFGYNGGRKRKEGYA